jgi:hypothetical protein
MLSHGPLCGRATSVLATVRWFGRTSDVTDTFPSSDADCVSVLTMGTAVARMNALARLYVTPMGQPQGSVAAAGRESHCSATVVVAQPLSVSAWFFKTQWPRSRRQLRVPPLSGPCETALLSDSVSILHLL